jgi:tetratricopeptide (TPR) repeat protein
MPSAQDLLKRAEKAEGGGQHVEAGGLFERAGDVEKAIAAYRKGGAVDRAAALLEAAGRSADAAQLLMSVGQYLQSAALFEKVRNYPKAASALLRANQRERAAAMFEKGEAYEDAAKIYASLGNHKKAMQLYQEAGNAEKVSEMAAATQSADQQAAEEVLELDPSMEIAAGQFLDSKQVVDAVVAHLKAGRVPPAVELYENCQEDIGYNVLAAVAGDSDVEQRAAEMFMAARDYPKAGQIFENLEDYQRAGEMFERGDDAYMAGEMYARAGNKAKAGEMYEKFGNYKQAAELYLEVKDYAKAAVNFERAVNNFVAGKLYFRLNKTDKSLQLLQKVQKSESQYFEACKLIGEILAANGYMDLAIRKYLEVVQSAELSADTAPVYYNLARALEARGAIDQALSTYTKIVSWQFGYQDVAQRIKALQSGPPPAATVPAAPAFVPDAAKAPRAAAPAAAGAPSGQIVTMMGGFEFLKKTPLFHALSLDEMKAVYNACEVKKFVAGEALIEQGQPGGALYVLRKGTAKVVVRPAEGKENMVARLSPGSPAGEMALIDDAPTSARVVAETEVEAFCITRERFEKLLSFNEKTAVKLYRFFIQTLSKRLRSTSENFAKAAAARVPADAAR